MKSQILAGKLREIFGGDGENELRQLLAEAAQDHPLLSLGTMKFLYAADALITQLFGVHQLQSELSSDAFSDWNLKSGQIDSGKQWKVLLGYDDGDLEDTIACWRQLVQPDDLLVFDSAITACVAGKSRFFQAECRLKTKDGHWKWLFLKGSVVARDAVGEPMRFLLLHRDIKDFRQSEAEALTAREAAETANRARSYFMANMSHELRTPMNGIIGMTELALDTQLDAEQRHYLKTVKSSAESLLAIVNDILDFSKIEAGKLRFEEIPFSLSNLVFEAVRTQAVVAHKKGLEVIVSVAPSVPPRVVGDPTRVRQVISNLVGNAVKFTKKGDVLVDVTVEERATASVLLRFAVRDSGIGIPVSRQGAIFEAFSQADDSTTRRFGGTGLGLTICAHLVQMMSGHIWLDSVEGEGSCFYFTCRLGVDSAGVAAAPDLQFSTRRALLLVSHPVLAAQLLAFFARIGMQATHLSEAQAAVDAIEKSRTFGFHYDFVFVDAQMPAPGGVTLAESWQGSAHPEKLIMLLDTDQQRQSLKHLRELGVDAHLVKPIAPEDLIEALKLVCGLKSEDKSLLDSFDIVDQTRVGEAPQIEVLLAEDNPVNQELAERLLKKRGYRVTLANNGAEAVDYFEKMHFDFIFMDLQMPVMDGIEAAESIRSREMRRSWVSSQEFKQTYIIAMTANAMDGDRERCLQAGMDDYLSKPIKAQELYATIDRCLGLEAEDDSIAREPVYARAEVSLDLAAALCDLGDHDLLLTMAGMMVKEWGQHLSRIQSDVRNKNAAQLSMNAHTVKSLFAIFHAEGARRMALELEHAAKSVEGVDWERCAQFADVLALEMTRLKPEMERFVRGEIVI
ncbi:response regulator [Propionivibrio sp.]|uniref:response regulator n=1 Tax=Propionivibrio sp. TaxID=2212460 RepID=UPI00260BA615|nr:response regulator [Propionivibrio sp.]